MADLRAALKRDDCSPAPIDRVDVVIALALFALAMAWFSLTWSNGLELRDEGHLYSMSARVAQGAVPHRDFVDIYGPGVFWLTGVTLDAFDGRVLAVRVLLALLKASAVSATYVVGRSVAGRAGAVLGSLLAIAFWGRRSWTLNAPYASLFTLPILLAALASFLRAGRRDAPAGYVAAGLLAGASVLFKQSVGVFALFGFGLAILARGLWERRPDGGGTRLGFVLFAGAGVAALVPFAAVLTLRDYVVHLLPLHAFMALVAVAAWRRGAGGGFAASLRQRLLPFAIGAALPLAGTALLYATWGALDDLVYDMFVFPMAVPGYAQAVELPGLAAAALAAAALSLSTAACVGASRGVRAAAPWLVVGVALAALGWAVGPVVPLERLPATLDGVALTTLLILAALAFGPKILSTSDDQDPLVAARLAIVFFSCGLVVQIFPRAGFNVWLLAAALAPLAIALLGAGIGAAGVAGPQRAVAAGALAVLLAWWATPAVAPVLRSARASQRALALPTAEGLSMTERQYRSRRMADLEALVAHLKSQAPADAPLLVLSNQAMILYASGRPHLYPEHEYYLSLIGWRMLPERDLARLDEQALIARLRSRPDALVIRRVADREDDTPTHYARALPRLWAWIDRHYREQARFGVYSVSTPAH